MATKNPIFTSVISGFPTITSKKLIGSENYLSWSASVELWFMGQGYENHLVTPKDANLMLTKCNGRKSMHNSAAYYGNLLIPKFSIIFVPTKPALNFGLKLKDYTQMIFNDFIRWFLILFM